MYSLFLVGNFRELESQMTGQHITMLCWTWMTLIQNFGDNCTEKHLLTKLLENENKTEKCRCMIIEMVKTKRC